jgi:hypothetical protein
VELPGKITEGYFLRQIIFNVGLDELTDGKGDGCIAVERTRLEGVADHMTIHANHVELVRGPLLYPEPGPVVCMPVVLRWLEADRKN